MLWNFEKSSNMMAKIWQKMKINPCPTCLQPIFRLIPGTQKSNLGYPFQHYMTWHKNVIFHVHSRVKRIRWTSQTAKWPGCYRGRSGVAKRTYLSNIETLENLLNFENNLNIKYVSKSTISAINSMWQNFTSELLFLYWKTRSLFWWNVPKYCTAVA